MSRKHWCKEKDDGIEVMYTECLLYTGSCVRPLNHTGETKFLFNGVYISMGVGGGGQRVNKQVHEGGKFNS